MLKRGSFSRVVFVVLSFLIVFPSFIMATNPPREGLDVLDAPIPLSDNLRTYIDSILDLDHISKETLETLSFYKSIINKDKDELALISDSLFCLDDIPYAFLNEVNYQLGRESHYSEAASSFNIPYDDSPYPAQYFYDTWDNTKANPYSKSLSENDTIITLALTDSLNFCDYQFPLSGKTVVTSKFGWRNGRNHNGYDLDLEVWDPVKSSFAGVVRIARTVGHFGRLVVVRHHNGLETFYAHLHRYKVKEGDVVEAGQVIGLGGSSGRSTGSHLHYEIRFKGIPLDPARIIEFEEQELISNTIVLNKTKWSYGVMPKGINFHKVKKGDYLYKIAKSYGQTIDELCALNGINRNSLLRVGQKLLISKQ